MKHTRTTLAMLAGTMLCIPLVVGAQTDTTVSDRYPEQNTKAIETRLETRDALMEDAQKRQMEARERAEEERKRALEARQILDAARERLPLPEEKREMVETRINEAETRQAERALMQNERREALTERAAERVTFYTNRIVTRLLAAVERIETLGARIEARRVVVAETGADTSAVSSALNTARAELGEAKTVIASLQTLTLTSPREIGETIQPIAREVHDHLKKAHVALVEAIRLLKGLAPAPTASESSPEN